MSSPGQRRGSCGHAMAGFNTRFKCARCRDKGLGDDPCILKKECVICKGFTPDQVLQLATPTYKDRKEKKTNTSTTTSSTPTLVDPAHVSVLGKVEKVKAVQSTPTTKKTKRSESPKPSASKKRSSSSRPSAEDLKELDDKWAERFSRLEAMLLAKTFIVPVEPVVKPASDVTPTEKPFFEPTTSKLPVEKSLPTEKPGPCLDQATGNAVEEIQTATQPLGAPGAGIATQPVQAPGSFPEVQRTGDEDLSAASDSEADQHQGGLDPAPVVAENSKVTLNLTVNPCVANAHIVTGLPQRKGINPSACQMYTEIKYMKDVSCVGHLSSVNLVTNAPHAVIDPPVGARLNQYWEK